MNYHIVNVIPENEGYEIIQTFASYEDADNKFDEWSEKLPHAFLEIVYDESANY